MIIGYSSLKHAHYLTKLQTAVQDYNDGLIQATRLTKEFTGKSGNDLKAFRNEVSAVADVYGKEFKDVLTAADSLTANFGLTFDESIKVIKDGFAAGVDDGGDFLARFLQLFLCLLTDRVQARRIAVPIPHTVRHRLDRRFAHFGRCGVVRVYLHDVNSLVSLTSDSIITIFTYRVNR